MECCYIDWRWFSTLRAQLKLLRRTGVHVSSIGNAQMYQIFLADGSVHVNLGAVQINQQAFPLFMEQQLANGAPYIRAIYYNSSKRVCGLHLGEVMTVLQR